MAVTYADPAVTYADPTVTYNGEGALPPPPPPPTGSLTRPARRYRRRLVSR